MPRKAKVPPPEMPPAPRWVRPAGTGDHAYSKSPQQVAAETMGDRDNPDAVISICPEEMEPMIAAALEKYGHWYSYDEKQIRQKAEVDDRDERLRLAFWDEYSSATAQRRRMVMRNIVTVLVSASVWYNFYAKRLDKVAWMIYPPRNYSQALKNILDKGLDRLHEIMMLPILKPNGTPDVQTISQIIKVFQLVDARVKGAVVQRLQIQQQSVNLNADVTTQQLGDIASMSLPQLEEMERKLARIEQAEAKMIRALPPDEKKEILDMKAGLGPPTIEAFPLDMRDDTTAEERLVENKDA